MRHRRAGFKLKRDTDQRVGLLRTMVTNVIEQERIITTTAKAKAIKPLVDKMPSVTLCTPGVRRPLSCGRKTP